MQRYDPVVPSNRVVFLPAPALLQSTTNLIESCRPLRSKDLLHRAWRIAMREREFEVLGDELLDIRTTDVLCLFDLDNAEDLSKEAQTC